MAPLPAPISRPSPAGCSPCSTHGKRTHRAISLYGALV
jgi:hypothetical protein